MEEFGLHEYMGVDKGAVKVEIAQRLKCENKRRREKYRGRSGHSLVMWLVERGRPVSSDKAVRGNLKGLAVCCFFPFFFIISFSVVTQEAMVSYDRPIRK